MKKLLLAAILSIVITTPCFANPAHDLAMSYIIADQDPPSKPGDYLYHEDGTAHRLVETTGYYQGEYGSHGDKMRVGHVAYTQSSYGYCMEIYQAIETEEGYKLGDFIGLYEVRDCGYGRSTGEGTSELRKDRKYRGSIEAGTCVDRYAPTLSECKKWMKQTNGMIFIKLIPAKG